MIATLPFPNIDPEIFAIDIGGFHLALRWYALAYITGIILGWRLANSYLKKPGLWANNTPAMTSEQLESLLTWVILGIILGGRLGFVLFYQPAYYMQNPGEILAVWEGGMSFHGGMLGVIVALLLFAWANGLRILSVADVLAIATPPGILLGRLANFINAELWGRPTDLPWGVVFPGQAAQNCPGVEGVCARHPSQLYEAGMEGILLGLALVVLASSGALRRPGLLTGVFLTGYAVARFLVEFVRQADAQFITPDNPLGRVVQIGAGGLSMGQLLSLPMLAFGLWLIFRAIRRDRTAQPGA
ncbi:prolipoprotein diacylglyceryl transferase [Brevirhabdus pacifica]|uniref:Phosphatidylglycerol--prolipoprotein diacylglyceryl transferase n=1 Tax=Brevirhabdus pacifica TaxID=1267768 RepID=A0A1U7DKI0_9RHOB|nr:prolipoprotein diacylglyceryl transferase [Brevirhabdus pacifica]APX90389.1 prolipoprotein diacylglyceryl transferase [Brevirhabdus pacifica]OWU78586.1 diacylglyceryl transferase [Loktanella sp. 22II-4b]PJJ85523.1 prolipoprotein diacylglyceryl transferase [Brevirhabdus pacifica]